MLLLLLLFFACFIRAAFSECALEAGEVEAGEEAGEESALALHTHTQHTQRIIRSQRTLFFPAQFHRAFVRADERLMLLHSALRLSVI